MRGGGPCRRRDGVEVAVGLEDAERAAPEQEDERHDGQPDHGGAATRRRNEPARRSPAARPEAVAGRRVRRSPQEVGLMMGEIDQGVKEVAPSAWSLIHKKQDLSGGAACRRTRGTRSASVSTSTSRRASKSGARRKTRPKRSPPGR